MNLQPLFSVVIPAYNRAYCIENVINSVLRQTEQDFEIIIVDDGSNDNTALIVQELAKIETRIRIISQANGGASKARNTGIKAANGKFIAFLDSDDSFLTHHLAQAKNYLNNHPDSCVYAQIIADRGNDIQILKPHRGLKQGEHISDYLMADRGFVPTITLVVPKNIAINVLYDESLSKGDDYDYAIRLVAFGASLTMLPKPSAVWDDRYNPNRLSNKNNIQERINWINKIRNLITDKAFYSEMGWPVAKYLAEDGRKYQALKHYFTALFKGCFRPKMAVVIFLQIILSKNAYRKFSDVLAKFGVQP